ncbi:MAG TPA: metal-dependent hydrolase, partial [Planctomycetota bacterium]|nr:metal-dependent hydrolase [Planctomycetota bacterium]
MATVFTHAFVGAAIGAMYACGGKPVEKSEKLPLRFWAVCAIAAALPDFDVAGFHYDIAYGSLLGHRGITHSLLFALLLSFVAAPLACRGWDDFRRRRLTLVPVLFLVAASHGVIDAATNGGFGVAFFAPFENSRYFLLWRPIEVAHIGIRSFLREDGLYVLGNEFINVWVPTAIVTSFVLWLKSV